MFSVKIITQVGRKAFFNADFMFKVERKKYQPPMVQSLELIWFDLCSEILYNAIRYLYRPCSRDRMEAALS
jgi:hypothetical protein